MTRIVTDIGLQIVANRLTTALGSCSQRFLNRPFALKTPMYHSPVDVSNFGPFGKSRSLVFECQNPVITPIPLLFLHGRPATIRWGISLRIFFAINRMFRRWARPHIKEKSQKVIAPSSANGNALGAIPSLKTFIIRIRTALNHRSPYPIFRSNLSATGKSVRSTFHWSGFRIIAAATHDCSADKMIAAYFSLQGASAMADPIDRACRSQTSQFGSFDKTNCCQSSEVHAGQVSEGSHNCYIVPHFVWGIQ